MWWLIVKLEKIKQQNVYLKMKLNVTNNGKRQIGAVVGTEEYRKKYVITKKKMCKEIKVTIKNS